MYEMHIDGEHTGKFVYCPPIKGMVFIKNWDALTFQPGRFHVMQFTGLLDKNGREIYEGDTVREPYGDFFVDHVVRWSEENSGFWLGGTRHLNKGTASDVVVTGNIYENEG